LATHQDVGIIGDDNDLQRRKNNFGANSKPLPVPVAFWDSVKQEATNVIWAVITVTALVAGLCGLVVNGLDAVREAISIVALALGIVIIAAAADWFKDRRFVQIQSMAKDEEMTVIRGKHHATMKVNVWKLVVGDVLLLDTGMRIPADCLVISSSDLRVDESPEDEETQQLEKAAFDGRSGDPFLKADSLIIRGRAKALVCCVGANSTRGAFMKGVADDLNTNTPLQNKLKNLANQFSKYALLSSFVVLAILITLAIVETIVGGEATLEANVKEGKGAAGIIFSKIPKHINLAVVLLIVSIPEALPLTVGVSLAFSVMKMYGDGILIRKLDAPERLAGCEELCCGKTATLTENNMKVSYFYLQGQQIKNSRKDTFLHCELDPQTIELVKDSIVYNSTAEVELGDTQYVATGNGTEVGLLRFLQDSDIPIQDLTEEKQAYIRATIPFSSENKFSAVAVEHPSKPGQIALYIKGAPEVIMAMCPNALGPGGVMAIDQAIHEVDGRQVAYRDDFLQKVQILAG
jgi:Ca2+-transporting ATPase